MDTSNQRVAPALSLMQERDGLRSRAGGRSLLTPESGRELGADAEDRVSSGGGARDGPIEALASVEDQDRTAVAGGGEVSGAGPEHQGVTIGPGRRADRSDGTMRCA